MNKKHIPTVITLSAVTANCASGNEVSLAFLTELWGMTKTACSYLDTFASRGMNYSYSIWFCREVKNIAVDCFDWACHKIHSTTFRSPKETENMLKEGFKKIKGQEKPKKEMMNFALKVAHEKNEAKMNNRKRTKADFILLVGPSGVAKSKSARILAKAMSTAPAFMVSSGDIDFDNKNITIAEQLFGERQSVVNSHNEYRKVSEKNCLIAYIERVKHGVVIIDEYDKMQNKTVDEIFRAFASEEGKANVCGQSIDASNITFILTSNERINTEQPLKIPVIKEQENKDPLNTKDTNNSKITDAAGADDNKNSNTVGTTREQTAANEQTNELDKTVVVKKDAEQNTDSSRTTVNRDVSYKNRLTIVEFGDLSESDYEEIVKSDYGTTMPKYWKKYANINLDISKVFKTVAEKAKKSPERARAIGNIMSKLTSELSVRSNELSNKNVSASYNPETDEFYLDVS